MKLTSDAASKRLKMLQDEYDLLLQEEARSTTRTVLITDYTEMSEEEREKRVKGEFDFRGMQGKLNTLQLEIESLKHAINVFNASTMLLKHGITIDQALVRMAFLSKRKKTLREMQVIPDVARPRGVYSMHESTDIEVCSFHQEEAKEAYRATCDELFSLQQELNYVNVTKEFQYDSPTE